MSKTIDLNADMGESFGDWTMGNDAALLDVITSANIACGYHAGDPDVMAATMALALDRGVALGAHPGFPDLQGFGRRNMTIPQVTLANMVRYQVGAAQGMARAAGGRLNHLKLHGALANMCSRDAEMAKACYRAALDIDPDLIIMAITGTAQQSAVEALGCHWAGEIFADRAYNDDATLVDRALPGAVIHDAAEAAQRIVNMVQKGALIAVSGAEIPVPIQTICMHGDTAGAVDIARSVKSALMENDVNIAPLSRA